LTTLTPPPAADVTAPVISAVAVSAITQTGATVTWTTDEPATSQLDYGLTGAWGSTTTLDSTLSTSHAVILSGLTANTLYHLRAKSQDAAANLANGSDTTFTTLPVPTPTPDPPPTLPPPQDTGIFSIGVQVTTTDTVIVRNEPALSEPSLGSQLPASQATIVDGPVFDGASGFTFWQVAAPVPPSGWVQETNLALTVPPVSTPRFILAASVRMIRRVHVRAEPTILSPAIGTQKRRTQGVITDGPVDDPDSAYTFWQVHFDRLQSGWIRDDHLVAVSTFTVGASVKTTTAVSVRSGPAYATSVLGTQAAAATATILALPVFDADSGAVYWHLDFVSGVDGWVEEDLLRAA